MWTNITAIIERLIAISVSSYVNIIYEDNEDCLGGFETNQNSWRVKGPIYSLKVEFGLLGRYQLETIFFERLFFLMNRKEWWEQDF